MSILKIKGVVKNYAWGNEDFIPSLIGGKDGKPQAEYWMGTHPSGEATTLDGEKLSEVLGFRLPFLFKVLAIKAPLSLQCHPNKEQAREGYAREAYLRHEGLPYNYQDDNEKAEVIAAITPITAMCGFKPYEEGVQSLKNFIPSSYAKYLKGTKDIKSLFFGFFALSQEEKNEVLDELSTSLALSHLPSEEGPYLTTFGIVRTELEAYPGDIGCVFPLLMNVLHVAPGEALYLEPDTLHAYVRGNGMELMTASDNVLRGGLTPKRIDLEELARIMYFGETEAKMVETEEKFGVTFYKTPSPDFRLGCAKTGTYTIHGDEDAIILVLEGKALMQCGDETVALEKGETAFISEEDGSFTLTVDGVAYLASSPEA
ncbi:MAG: mannose-6-phosphate isomerase, class I [Spirochaetales bacterium]|nr:mannose-6-phosphate isomerase, class I [Candidatus Physcosoma equi]